MSTPPLLLCRIAWMRRYNGHEPDLFGAGSDPTVGYDWEAYNFSPFSGNVYGYCSASRHRRIDVDRLGGSGNTADGVTVAWIAPHPSGGQRIVGWYRNATVFRELQPSPKDRHCPDSDGGPVQFNLKAAATDAVLLEPHKRSFEVPRGRGFMGQANVSYLQASEARSLRERLLEHISSFVCLHAGYPDEVPAGAYVEGATVQVTSNAFERDRQLRKACLDHFGYRCVICETQMGAVYGELAEHLIHVHHLTPLSQVGAAHEVHPTRDLRPVCPNCHAVMHLQNPPLTPDQVREMLASTGWLAMRR